jgi:predicted enzyme related to lactoylglutathione lyase
MIEGIAGVIIWTDNLEEMAAFYRDKLELEVHSIRPYFVAFQCGDLRLSLGTHSQVEGPSREPRIMVNLAVSDIKGVYDKLLSRGVEFVRPPEFEHWGGWVATLSDPDGNLLQLLQQEAS